jgi:hypothetical protein
LEPMANCCLGLARRLAQRTYRAIVASYAEVGG